MTLEEKYNLKKLFLIIIKYIPIILSILYTINSILYICGIGSFIINSISGASIISLLFILISSFLFEFCVYHRIFIYYLLLINILNIIDWIFIIPISAKYFILTIIFLFIITCFIAVYIHFKNNEKVRIIKSRASKHNR